MDIPRPARSAALAVICGSILSLASAGCGVAVQPPATATPASARPGLPAETIYVLFFPNQGLAAGDADCGRVFPVPRVGPVLPPDRFLEVLLQLVLGGPSDGERGQGFDSMLGPGTSDALIGARREGETAYVNLKDIRGVIPNASTSCGSRAFLAQVETTVLENTSLKRVFFAIEGKPETFYEWLQIGCDQASGNCDPAPFRSISGAGTTAK